MMSSAEAPAALAARACSTASTMPSQTIDEITGTRPSTAWAVMRVTSVRSAGVSENTSPVWPLVIRALMPRWPASQRANRVSPAVSMLKSSLKGTAIAGISPLRSSVCGTGGSGFERSGRLSVRRHAARTAHGLGQAGGGGGGGVAGVGQELRFRPAKGRGCGAEAGDRHAVDVDDRGGDHPQPRDGLLVGEG